MKKFLLSILMVVFASMSFTVSIYASTIDKKVKVSSFTGMQISSIFDVTLSKGNTHSVDLTMSEELEKYVIAKVKGNTLYLMIDTDKAPRSITRNIGKYVLKAKVTIETLSELDMSGNSKLTCGDKFIVDEFDCDVSGSSNIKSLQIDAKKGSIDVSGASRILLNGEFSEIEYDISGASYASSKIKSSSLEIDASGASKIKLDGVFTNVNLDCSGASHIELIGSTDSFYMEISGASSVNARDLISKTVKTDISGASAAIVNPQTYLSVILSGSSALKYKGNNNLKINKIDIGSHTSLKMID